MTVKYVIFVALLIHISVVGSRESFGREFSAAAFLNDQLSKKAKVFRRVILTKKVRQCQTIIFSRRDQTEVTRCTDKDISEVSIVPDFARVTSGNFTRISDVKFDKENIVGLPETAIIDRITYENCTSGALTKNMSLSFNGTKGFSVSKRESVATTNGGSAAFNLNFKIGSLNTTFNFSRNITIGNEISENLSEVITRSGSEILNIGPFKTGKIELYALQSTAEVPFSAEVTVDGPLEANENNLTLASHFLLESERSLRFSGVLRLTNLSESQIKYFEDKVSSCGNNDKPMTTTSVDRTIVPASALPKFYLEKQPPVDGAAEKKREFSFFTNIQGGLDGLVIDPTPGNGPAITVPDGVHYEVLYTVETARMHPACGFNDAAVPNIGVFNVEHRRYRSYSNGRMVSQWDGQEEKFSYCRPV